MTFHFKRRMEGECKEELVEEFNVEVLGFSKINIGLAILHKRTDGYHNIDTVFQSIALGDSLYFAKHHEIVFHGAVPELPSYMQKMIPFDESNLALKALRSVQKYTGCQEGAAIHLLKRVPPAAGLGGGSADAALMIKGLNKFWDLRLTEKEMFAIAESLGADVPFLLKGGTARGSGKGEVLRPLSGTQTAVWLLLVRPELSISTAAAYARFSEGRAYSADSKMIDAVEAALAVDNMQKAFSLAENTFEELVFSEHDELRQCKEFFINRGYEALMSGSGPTITVLLPTAKDALALQAEIKSAGYNWLSLITKTCGEKE